jgi:hypothetical protein
MCAQLILTQFFVINILGVNMYKFFKSYKNLVPYNNVQGSKKMKILLIEVSK